MEITADWMNNWLFGDKIRFLGSYDSQMVSIHLRLLYKNDQWNHASGFATNISTSLSLKMQPQRDWLTCGARCVGSEPPKCLRPDANGILRVRIWTAESVLAQPKASTSLGYLELQYPNNFKVLFRKEAVSCKLGNLQSWTEKIVGYGYFRPLACSYMVRVILPRSPKWIKDRSLHKPCSSVGW